MTGKELQEILRGKWGYSFDVQLRSTKGKIFFQVMWRYLEQISFPMTEEEYLEHLNTVANYLNSWGVAEQVKEQIKKTRERPRLGKAISIVLDLGERASEWILD
jgi:hypothetical protein